MEKKALITYEMNMTEALEIVKQVLMETDKDVEGHEFYSWNNKLPKDCFKDNTIISLSFIKKEKK